MEWEKFLSAASNIATLIGLPIAYLSFVKDEPRAEQALSVFRGLTDVADRWKVTHNIYHSIFQDLRNINSFLNMKKSFSDVNVDELRDVLRGCSRLRDSCGGFRRDVEVQIKVTRELLGKKAASSGIAAEIAAEIGEDYGRKAQAIFNAQADAIEANDEFCDFTDRLSAIYARYFSRVQSGDYTLLMELYNNMEVYYNSYNRVILKTDEILLNTIDFFRLVARARL